MGVSMDDLVEASAILCDHIRHLWTLKQQEANVRVDIADAYDRLGVMLQTLPDITEKTTAERRKELQT